jgi:hypothetical protein
MNMELSNFLFVCLKLVFQLTLLGYTTILSNEQLKDRDNIHIAQLFLLSHCHVTRERKAVL